MNATYLLTEIRRNFRAPRFLIFVVAFPVLMFLLQASVFVKAIIPPFELEYAIEPLTPPVCPVMEAMLMILPQPRVHMLSAVART